MWGGWNAERAGVTVEALATILAALDVSLKELFRPFKEAPWSCDRCYCQSTSVGESTFPPTLPSPA